MEDIKQIFNNEDFTRSLSLTFQTLVGNVEGLLRFTNYNDATIWVRNMDKFLEEVESQTSMEEYISEMEKLREIVRNCMSILTLSPQIIKLANHSFSFAIEEITSRGNVSFSQAKEDKATSVLLNSIGKIITINITSNLPQWLGFDSVKPHFLHWNGQFYDENVNYDVFMKYHNFMEDVNW